MNIDVERASKRLRDAAFEYVAIDSLPTVIGSKVRWPHNGVVWERIDEDEWQTDPGPGQGWAPSSHVASIPFEEVSE